MNTKQISFILIILIAFATQITYSTENSIPDERWILTQVIDRKSGSVFKPQLIQGFYFINSGAENLLVWDDGCNSVFSAFKIQGNELTITPEKTTLKGCFAEETRTVDYAEVIKYELCGDTLLLFTEQEILKHVKLSPGIRTSLWCLDSISYKSGKPINFHYQDANIVFYENKSFETCGFNPDFKGTFNISTTDTLFFSIESETKNSQTQNRKNLGNPFDLKAFYKYHLNKNIFTLQTNDTVYKFENLSVNEHSIRSTISHYR